MDATGEIVEDSEGEEESRVVPTGIGADVQTIAAASASSMQTPALHMVHTATGVSNISDFTEQPPKANAPGLSISSFSPNQVGHISVEASTLGAVAKPRPRPRPLKKKALEAKAGSAPYSSAIVSPGQASEPHAQDLPLISDDAPFASANIAERAKMHSRNASKQSSPASAPLPESAKTVPTSRARSTRAKIDTAPSAIIIELTSDEEDERDELAMSSPKPAPKPKPKPKAKPRPKTKKVTVVAPPMPSLLVPDSQAPIPHSTSPQLPTFPSTPQLPPSDIPLPSTATEGDHPPIAVLANISSDAEMSDRGRAPSPLFSPAPVARKRRRPVVSAEDAALEPGAGGTAGDMLPPPPPAFFASSSSSMGYTGFSLGADELEASTSMTSVPPMQDDISTEQTTSAVGEVDGDTAAGKKKAPKKNRKAPAKSRSKKSTAAAESPQMEVVIEARSTSAKSKGKGKVLLPSNEITAENSGGGIDQVEGEHIPTRVLEQHMQTSGDKLDSAESALSSLPGSDADAGAPAADVGSRAKSRSRKRKQLADDDDSDESYPQSPKRRKGKTKSKTSQAKSGKGKRVVLSDAEEEEEAPQVLSNAYEKENSGKSRSGKAKAKTKPAAVDEDFVDAADLDDDQINGVKENRQPATTERDSAKSSSPNPAPAPASSSSKISSRSYSIAPRVKSTPMSELIRRVNSMPGSPFPASPAARRLPGLAYSPYLKANRSALSRIAPLHPNRRTPPPPLPRPPPPKKTKKEREREEQWEEELVESVGGVSEWACLTDAERKEMRRIKFEREMGGYEE